MNGLSALPRRPGWLTALASRHAQVWKAAWSARHQLVGPTLLATEAAFLPAALSLQATPVHPAPRRAAALICTLFAVALVWACLGRVDIVAVAPGRIIVSDGSKTVQPLETSLVKAILVRNGDHVQEGQLLIELDATQSLADGRRAEQERLSSLSEIVRTHALMAAVQGAAVVAPAPSATPAADGWDANARHDTQMWLETEWADISAKVSKLLAEVAHRQAEIETADDQIDKLQATLPMARQRERDIKSLSDQGFMAGHASQDRLRERVEMEKDLTTARAHRAEMAAGLAETREALASYRSETLRSLHERQSHAVLKRQELDQELAKTTQRTRLARLLSPVVGTVQQLAVHTPGGVVTPAQVLLVVIPDNAQVTAEVQLENRDVGFVREGQHAAIKLETFEFTRYGTIDAEVNTISADAVVDEKHAKEGDATAAANFPARLTLSRNSIDVDGKRIRLTPGMNLTAEIKTGRRRLIDYLLSPVQKHLEESVHER